MTKSEGNPNDETRKNDQRSAKRHTAAAFELRASSFVIHPRRNAKRIEPPFHAYHPPNGQRHADAPVPRRQVTAFSGFADRFPLASIRTQGELEAIAAGRRHAQINARPDDTTQLGDGLVLVL